MELKEFAIWNFRSIEHLEVLDLQRFTLFIGPNNSGKSTIFRAIQALSTMMLKGDYPLTQSDRSAYTKSSDIRIQAKFAFTPDERNEVLTRAIQNVGPTAQEQWTTLYSHVVKEHLTSVTARLNRDPSSPIRTGVQIECPSEFDTELLRLSGRIPNPRLIESMSDSIIIGLRQIIGMKLKFLGPIRRPQPQVAAMATEDFDEDALNFLQSVYHHRGDDTPEYREWRALVQRVFPQLEEILVPPRPGSTTVSLGFREQGIDHTINLDAMSSGLQEALVILARLVFSPPGSVIAIEEPEVHFHQDSLRKIVTLLTDASKTKQVLLSTHSGFFIVDDISREPEEIVEVYRTTEHGTKAKRLATEEDVDQAYNRLHGLPPS